MPNIFQRKTALNIILQYNSEAEKYNSKVKLMGMKKLQFETAWTTIDRLTDAILAPILS